MANEKKSPKADPEQVRRKKEEQARRSRRRNRQLLGLVLSVLIIWGAVSIVRTGMGAIQILTDNTEEKLEYQGRIETLVMFDALPFENVAQLDMVILKEAGLWHIFYEKGETLAQNEREERIIPASELDRYGRELFGPDFSFGTHRTFTDDAQGLTYVYDEEQDAYMHPVTGLEHNYLPIVVDIQRMSGGYRRVVVGYAALRASSGAAYSVVDYDHPVRYMDFIFRRDGNEWYLDRLERNTTHVVTLPEDEQVESLPEIVGAIPDERDDVTSFPEDEDGLLDGSTSLPPDDGSSLPAGEEGGDGGPDSGDDPEGADSGDPDTSGTDDSTSEA